MIRIIKWPLVQSYHNNWKECLNWMNLREILQISSLISEYGLVRRVILASCMNHKMNWLLYHVWIRNLRHPVEIRKFFVAVAIHPVLYSPVSRVTKKISFKDNMECIAILRHSWMIHDTFWSAEQAIFERNLMQTKTVLWGSALR